MSSAMLIAELESVPEETRRAGKITERKLLDIRQAVCQVVRGEI
jgi:hypothetical protein